MELELRFKRVGSIQFDKDNDPPKWTYHFGIFETLSADYPTSVALQFWGDKNFALLEALEEEEVYNVSMNPKSNEGKNGMWYTSLSCWKVERKDMQTSEPANEPVKKETKPKASNTPTSNRVNQPTTPVDHKEEDDLPY